MGCKFCKILSYGNQETVKKKKHRRSKYRKRHGNRSSNRHNHPRQYQPKDEIIDMENLPHNDSNNFQYEMKTLLPTNDDGLSEHSVTLDEFVDIEVADPDAFKHIFIQQRQQAIDNHSYRTIIEAWQPNSLQHLAEILKTFSKEKSFIDRHWIIFYWIAYNIEYDTVSYFAKDYKNQSAEGVFRTRKGVCAGYANLYKYFCDQLQMPCEIVSGYAKGYGFDDREEAPSEINHAWNAIEIDGHWYLMESTWGTGYINDRKEFTRELKSYYFLPRPNEMIYHHLPEVDKWQLLRIPIKMLQFMQIPKVRPNYFELNLQLIQPKNQYFIRLQKDKPFALVIIRAPDDVQLTANLQLDHEIVDGGHRIIFDGKKRQYYCYFAPSAIGKHKITIYAKRGETTVGTYHAAVDLALNIKLIPENPISYAQTWRCFFDYGLKILSPSHTHLINLKDDERFVQIIIRAPSDIDLMGQLKNHEGKTIICGERVYYDRQKDFWRCKFAPNENGIFQAIILAKKKTDPNSYSSVVSFKIAANHVLSPPFSFPKTWQIFYDLDLKILYPLGRGIILLTDKLRYAEIRIKAPNDVHLVGQFRNENNEEIPCGEQVYYDNDKEFWRCKFAPNQIGIFDAIILARKKSDTGSFTSVALFKIEIKEPLNQPAYFLNTTQLFHDLKLKVLSPLGRYKIVLSKKSSYAEISLKVPNDVVLLGQLINSNKNRILNGDQVYYDRTKDLWCCKFAPNQNGLFNAVILAKKGTESGLYSTVITFQIEANHIPTPPFTFPQTWQLFYDFDLKIESPQSCSSAIWSETSSYTEILIQAPDDIQLSCRIEYNNIKIENGSLAQFDNDRKLWQLLFAPEQIGQHELIIYAKRTTDIDSLSNAVVKFNLDVTTLRQPMKFPMIYTQFETTKCRIYTPLNGLLKKGSLVPIHCIIPHAELIQVTIDSKRIRSDDYHDPIFKREILVGSEEVTIYGKYSESPHYTSLIRYSVE